MPTDRPTRSNELELLMRVARRVPLMDADEELSRARKIRRLRDDYWGSILRCSAAREQLERIARARGLEVGAAPAAADLMDADPASSIAHAVVDALQQRADAGDDAARLASWLETTQAIRTELERERGHFVRANLRLVVKTAHRFQQPTRLPLVDLVQEGNLGLLDAIDRFDPDRKNRFSTYAVWWVFHRMTRALAEHGRLVRVPSNIQALFHRVRKRRAELADELGREPTVSEVAKRARIRPDEALRAERLMRAAVVSTDVSHTFERRSLDTVAPDRRPANPAAVVDAHMRVEQLEAELEQLPKRQREILARRFGLGNHEPSSLREIAEDYGVSGERIRQVQNAALRRLRSRLGEAPLAA